MPTLRLVPDLGGLALGALYGFSWSVEAYQILVRYTGPAWRAFPKKRSSFTRYAEILAAPALRRLGRAGLEAPPRSGPLR